MKSYIDKAAAALADQLTEVGSKIAGSEVAIAKEEEKVKGLQEKIAAIRAVIEAGKATVEELQEQARKITVAKDQLQQ